MKAGDVVKHRGTGRVGVVLVSIAMLRQDGMWSVIYDHSAVAEVILKESDFQVIGQYQAAPTPDACGSGKGGECCMFFGMGSQGAQCLRFTGLHWSIAWNKPYLRNPDRIFPHCQLPKPN